MKAYCAFTGTFKVSASDNTSSSGSFDVNLSGNGNNPSLSSSVAQTIVVTHGIGTSKKVSLSFSGDINSNYYHTYPNESTTVAVYTATAYTLTIDQGTGTNLEAYLYSSPFQSASGVLTNGKTIYGGELLRVWGAVQSEAYKDFVLNVSGFGDVSTGDIFTVSGNHTVKTTATLKTYTLTISADSHSEVAVKRGAETLISGDVINHFDLLTVTFSTASGYKVKTATLNGGDIASPADHTVTGDVTIVLVTEATGFVYIDNTVSVNPYIPFVDMDDHWEQHISNIDNRSAFELYGG